MTTTIDWLRQTFRKLKSGTYAVTSDFSDEYNCIAWAADETDHHWWPIDCPDVYWPLKPPYDDSLEGFVKAFATRGYKRCANGRVEKRFDKVAIYVDANGKPKHMAKQLGGVWSSKLGVEGCDIAHEYLDGINCPNYGEAKHFLRRRTKGGRWGCLSFGILGKLR